MQRFFLPLLLTTIVLAIFLPVGQYLKPTLPFLLSTLLFFNFYRIDFERRHFYQRELLLYFFVVLVVLPGLVFIATRQVSPSFRLGIFLTAITPSAISSPIVVGMLRGNVGLAIANTVIYNLLSPLSYTLLTRLYFNQQDLKTSVSSIIVKLILLVFIPFLLALFCKKIPRLTRPLHAISAYVNLLFLFLVFTAVSSSAQQIKALPASELLLVLAFVLMIAIVLYVAGFLLGRNLDSRKALAVGMGQKNSSLCVWLALSNFDPLTAIPPAVYIIIHHIMNSLLLFIFSREQRHKGQT